MLFQYFFEEFGEKAYNPCGERTRFGKRDGGDKGMGNFAGFWMPGGMELLVILILFGVFVAAPIVTVLVIVGASRCRKNRDAREDAEAGKRS